MNFGKVSSFQAAIVLKQTFLQLFGHWESGADEISKQNERFKS